MSGTAGQEATIHDRENDGFFERLRPPGGLLAASGEGVERPGGKPADRLGD